MHKGHVSCGMAWQAENEGKSVGRPRNFNPADFTHSRKPIWCEDC